MIFSVGNISDKRNFEPNSLFKIAVGLKYQISAI